MDTTVTRLGNPGSRSTAVPFHHEIRSQIKLGTEVLSSRSHAFYQVAGKLERTILCLGQMCAIVRFCSYLFYRFYHTKAFCLVMFQGSGF